MNYLDADEHASLLMASWNSRVIPKYKAGQKEHGGKLWRKPVMGCITEEIIDLLVYWDVQLEQYGDAMLELKAALQNLDQDHGAYPFVRDALNIMVYGNREGVLEEERNG